MKTRLLVIILAISVVQSNAQVFKVDWQKRYSNLQSYPLDILELNNGDIFCLAGQDNLSTGGFDNEKMAILKVNSFGDSIWAKFYDGNGNLDMLHKIIPSGDGNYICLGITNSTSGIVNSNNGGEDIWLMKIDPNGNVIWSKTFGGSNNEKSVGITATSDNGFVISASTLSNNGDVQGYHGTTGTDIWLFKVNQQGSLTWSKCFGNPNSNDKSSNVVQHNGVLQILFNPQENGSEYSVVNFLNNYLVKLDLAGNVLSANLLIEAGGPFITYPSMNLVKSSTIVKVNNKLIFNCEATLTQQFQFNLATMGRFYVIDELGNYLYKSHTPSWFGGGANFSLTYIPTTNSRFTLTNNDNLLSIPQCVYNNQSPADFSLRLHKTQSLSQVNFVGQPLDLISTYTYNSGLPLYDGVLNYNSNTNAVTTCTRIVVNSAADIHITKFKPISINTIKGKVYVDKNSNNNKDANEPYYTEGFVKSAKATFSTQSQLTQSGSFFNTIDTGTFVSNIVFNKQYYTANPVSRTTNFTTSGNTDSFDIALQPIPNINDVIVSLTPLGPARPGFNVSYDLTYKNVGTTILSSTIKLVKAAKLNYVGSNITPTSVAADTIIWNYTNLTPDSSSRIIINFTVAAPPAAIFGDTLKSTAIIYPVANDQQPIDNEIKLKQLVTGAYDPNDKLEINGGTFTTAQLSSNEDLQYTIRFQNTGNDTAFNIKVIDTLDSKLNTTSLQMITSSHPYELTVKNGQYCEWLFRNILLPDSNRNEPASHGYVTYKIKPKNTVQINDTIKNSASIYFDFNEPIKTNTEKTVIKPLLLAVPQPILAGLNTTYCSNVGIVKPKLTNIPIGTSYAATIEAKLDGTTILPIATDSTVTINTSTLSIGLHQLVVTYSNLLGSQSQQYNFTITPTYTPDVALNAAPTNVSGNIVFTATNVAGGGTTPLYTFARDRNFATIVQAEAPTSILAIPANSILVGLNWFYTKMKTSEHCFTTISDIDSFMIPIVPQPSTSIIKTTYCSNEGSQVITLNNIPTPPYLATATVRLDNNIITINNGQFNFNVSNLALGQHEIKITYTNAYATTQLTHLFIVNPTFTPDVTLNAVPTNANGNIIFTATNTTGGGVVPLYTFARDRNFANIIQPEGATTTLSIAANTLPVGLNWFYVRMKTNEQCHTTMYDVDSFMIPIVPIPTTTLIKNEYCNLEGPQVITLTNMPTTIYQHSTTVKVNGVTYTVNNNQFSFNVGNLPSGNNVVTVTYTNPYNSTTITKNFFNKIAITPVVTLSSDKNTLTAGEIANLAATPATAGNAPLYTFAWNNSFTNLLQPTSINATAVVNAVNLMPGNYKIYVRIKTTETCYTREFAYDSISITKQGRVQVIDNNIVISITPNPFKNNINIAGLNTAKQYTLQLVDANGKLVLQKQVSYQPSYILHTEVASGVYILTITNTTDNKKLNAVKLIKE